MTSSVKGSSPPEGVVVLMFTDIVGSTALRDAFVNEHGELHGDQLYRDRVLDVHNGYIRPLLKTHHGFELKTNGDSFMASFSTAAEAIQCAAAIQLRFFDDPISTENGPLSVRIGLHIGQPSLYWNGTSWDYDGHAVNIAARVESLIKGGGQILCSSQTASVATPLPNIRFHACGEYPLKGLANPVGIVEVLWRSDQEPSAPGRPLSLPYPWLNEWVGRSTMMSALSDALRSHRLVTIHGPGGVGKTRIATEVLLRQGKSLARNIVFVPLAARRNDADDFFLALRESTPEARVIQTFDAYCEFARGRDLLLVLDNFESVSAATQFLPRLTAAGTRLLITSQQALGLVGEKVIFLPEMGVDGKLDQLDSYRLFAQVARQDVDASSPDDERSMLEILALCDGLPYLIEIVAASAHRKSIRQMADELRARRSEFSQSNKLYVASDRHRTVAACLDWTMSRLDSETRTALSKVAVFNDSFTTEAAAEICDTSTVVLDALLDAALLRVDRETARYSMLSSTRDFAWKQLGAMSESVAASHGNWFLRRLETAVRSLDIAGGEEQIDGRHWITNERANIRSAIEWAEQHDTEAFAKTALIYRDSLLEQGFVHEALRLARRLVDHLDPEADPKRWAAAQNMLGAVLAHLPDGDPSENLQRSIDCFEQALIAARKSRSVTAEATVLDNLGNAYAQIPTGDQQQHLLTAIEYYEAALQLYAGDEYAGQWAHTQNNLGAAYSHLPTGPRREHLRKAIECHQAALSVFTRSQFPIAWASNQHNLGMIYLDVPSGDMAVDFVAAINCFEAALHIRTERDAPRDWANTQNGLGMAYVNLPFGDRDENLRKAIHYYEEALRVFVEKTFPEEWAMVKGNLGAAYSSRRGPDRATYFLTAISHYEDALRVRTEQSRPFSWATTQNSLGVLHAELSSGDRNENLLNAISCFEAALRVRTEDGSPMSWASTMRNLGNVFFELPSGDRQSNLRKGIECFESALRVQTEHDNPVAWAITQNNIGYARAQTGTDGIARAIQHYRAALRVATESNHPALWAEVMLNLGQAHAAARTEDEAVCCLENAARGFRAVGLHHKVIESMERLTKLRTGQ